MLFNTLNFAAFLAIVLPVAALLAGRVRARNALLLIASYVFYAAWDWRFLGLIWISTAVDYGCGRLLDPSTRVSGWLARLARRRRLVLACSLGTNLGLLGVLKYFDFFVGSAAALLGSLGIEVSPTELNVVLPVGISFYTFQTLSYTVDVYRGQIRAEANPLRFALFVAFFPQLVAGPIERASRLLPQFAEPRVVDLDRLYSGLHLAGWGLLKKVVLADNLALVVDRVYSSPAPGGGAVVLATVAFALQIYCDFSGYSDIARGVARSLGFDIMVNFRLPYLALNPQDFWRRWHISLSTWLRDYLYIPLGGNRKGPLRTRLNLLVTMLLGGLWHGAGATFVLWGLFHGLWMWAHRIAAPALAGLDGSSSLLIRGAWILIRWLVTFGLVCFGWMLFRSKDLVVFGRMLDSLLSGWTFQVAELGEGGWLILVGSILVLVGGHALHLWRGERAMFHLPTPVRALLYAGGMLAFIFFGEFRGEPFIYFQF